MPQLPKKIGPLNAVEKTALLGVDDMVREKITRHKATVRSLEASLRQAKGEIAALRGRQEKAMVDILKGRGIKVGESDTLTINRPTDDLVSIIIG